MARPVRRPRGCARRSSAAVGAGPALVAEAVESLWAASPSGRTWSTTTFDQNEVRRHVTVLVLTGNRFIVSHTDEQAASTSSTPYATTSTESVKLDRSRRSW